MERTGRLSQTRAILGQSCTCQHPHPFIVCVVQYIQWRYAIGEDREALTKVSRVISEDEQKGLDAVHVIDGEKRKIEKLASRRKLKRSYEVSIRLWSRSDSLELPC